MESIVAFRARVRALLESVSGTASPPDVVILALDGIPHALAAATWRSSRIEAMRSVFPTTSATGWLSSLMGATVEAHGVPGVVFRIGDEPRDPIDVFAHRGLLAGDGDGNVFADAAALGWDPLAILGDLEPWDCGWRDTLLHGAQRLWGWRFLTEASASAPDARRLCERLRRALATALERPPGSAARLVWCFLDVDRHIHRCGYDDHVHDLLAGVERVARELAERGVLVVAHADHGLVPTRTDPAIRDLLAALELRGCVVGGAGRTRWIYASARMRGAALRRELAAGVPPTVRVRAADELFAAGSLARRRVGDVVLVAEGEAFVTSPGYRFDHGSMQPAELEVPCAIWRA